MICNYVSKIIPALQSRCTRFRFGPLDDASVLSKLNEVAKCEELVLENNADKAIVSLSGGDMRKVLNILESCSLAYKTIPEDKIFEVTGRPSPADVNLIFDAVSNKSFNEANDIVLKLKLAKSLSVDDIVREVHT
jgi:replication factor C subunit 3/5